MERQLTLKHFLTLLVFTIPAFSAYAQNYNNIEFIENKGQWDERVKYKGDVSAGALFIRSGGFTMLQHNVADLEQLHQLDHHGLVTNSRGKPVDEIVVHSHAFNVDFVGANPSMEVVPDKKIDTYNNYILGNDPAKWAGECHIYQAVTLKEVYPNVDVRYYTYNGTLKYDIIARPGADISKIALKYDGVTKLQVKNKELVVSTSLGDLKEANPYSYQPDLKGRREVTCKYIIKDNVVRFELKDYDPNTIVVIDPLIKYCSFTGSTADNWGFTATYGPDGSFYGGGIVRETNGFPVSSGAFQTTFQGGVAGDHPGAIDMGIMKLSPNLSTRMYATYIGGSGNDQPHSLVVDPAGELIVCGRSNSANYPIYPLGSGTPSGQGYDIVVTKLNAAGSLPIGSKKIGGSQNDGVNITIDNNGASSLQHNYGDGSRSEVILDNGGNIYVASCSQSPDFPTTPGAFQRQFSNQNPTAGLQDGVILKFPPDVSSLTFSTFLGGTKNDAAYVLSLDGAGNIYVAGGTESGDFPGNHAGTVGPTLNGGVDGFVAVISNNGSTLIRSTYIGSTNGAANSFYDQVYGIQFDRKGFPYIMGQTNGPWKVLNAPYSEPNSKQFIAKLQPDLSGYVYSTIFGTASNSPNISPTAFLVDRCENVYVSGWGGEIAPGYDLAGTTGMTTTADALQSTTDGKDFYFYVLRRDAAGPGPLFATYFGQNGGLADHVDGGTSRFDVNGVIYQAICANCGGGVPFPTTPGAYAPVKPAAALCNLAMVKIAFNLSGVGANVQSAIGGVPRDTAGCLPLTVVFTDQIRNALQYIWNFGDGTGDFGPMSADTGYTRSHLYNAVGTYHVMLVAIDPTSCNVRDTSYINIRVGDLKANLAFSYHKSGSCDNLDFLFSNNSTTDPSSPFKPTSFTWDFGDGTPPEVHGMEDVLHTFPAAGSYHIKLILHDTTYCNDPDELDSLVNIAARLKASFTTPPTGCAAYEAVFTYTGTGGQTFQWDFGDPASGADNTSTLSNPSHVYQDPGSYTITLTATDPNTCNVTDVTTGSIVVYQKPDADFSFSPVTPIENTPVTFTNLSSAIATHFKWLFGDGDSLLTTSRQSVQHQYVATGTFNACLIAFNDVGCAADTCKAVSTIVIPALDVPNAFTPNSGNVNSKVYVRGFGIVKMRFIIWNRWGQKVFETNSTKEGWDGKVRGTVQPMDVYAYTLDVEFFDGTKAAKKGDITLIR